MRAGAPYERAPTRSGVVRDHRESISQPEKLAFMAVDHVRGDFGVENGLGTLSLRP